MTFVTDGQQVYAKVKGKRLLVTVAVACGDHARVMNELHSVDTWRHVRDLEPALLAAPERSTP